MARDNSGLKNEPEYLGTGVPADAADLTELGKYAAFTGNRKVGPAVGTATGPGGSNTGRTTSTGKDVWEGLEWEDTTDGFTYKYRGGSWVRIFDDTGWILVGSGGTAPAFQSNWVNFGGSYQLARFRRLNGIVYVQGAIKGGQTSGTFPIFTLPAGFRPAAVVSSPAVAISSGSVTSVDIYPDGGIRPGGVLSATLQSIVLAPFPADQ
ncbi:hypothetical protein ACF1AJ_20405 [Leifsonia sp. NPDC014704]|uniref:hypothetical protein n=1 Tax=Leifsonia sp. NPDC014704 TaxID=3364123 RepID=UPI0036F494A9